MFDCAFDICLEYAYQCVLRYYSDLDQPHGFYKVSIDGSEPERLSGRIDGEQVTQQMKWSKTDLSPGTHTFTLTQDDVGGRLTSCDFFRSVTSEAAE